MLTGKDILAIDDLERETIDVPEWDCTITVQTMTGLDKDEYDAWIYGARGNDGKPSLKHMRALITVLSCVDENGVKLFSVDEIEAVSKKASSALDRIYVVADRLSKLSDKSVEDIAGE